RGGDPALPDDRRGDRTAAGAVPHDGGLALGGDFDRRHALPDANRRDDLLRDGDLARPDVVGVVGDVGGRREPLRELALGGGDRRTRAVEGDRARRGGALVQCEDHRAIGHAGTSNSRWAPSRYISISRPHRASSQPRRGAMIAATPAAIDAPRSRSSGARRILRTSTSSSVCASSRSTAHVTSASRYGKPSTRGGWEGPSLPSPAASTPG